MIYVDAKSILSANNNVNIYRGCNHGCIYCDTLSECYQVKHYYEIEVKKNAIEIFTKELSKRRKNVVVHTGAMSDPYVDLELELKLTKQMLEIIYKLGHGIYLLTKSTRVLRDLDLYKKINENYKSILCMTLTTYDDELCKIIEPNVDPTSKRLEVLKTFSKNGIITGVWLCPILPYINDTKENIINLVKGMADSGVKFIVCFGIGMTLRKGNREYYYQKLDEHFKGLKERYIAEFGEAYMVNSPKEKELYQVLKTECAKYNILLDQKQIHDYLHKYHESEQMTLF